MENTNNINNGVQGEQVEQDENVMFGNLVVADESEETAVVEEVVEDVEDGDDETSSAPRTQAEILRSSLVLEKEHGLESTPATDALFELIAAALDVPRAMRAAAREEDEEDGIEIISEAVAARKAAKASARQELTTLGIL